MISAWLTRHEYGVLLSLLDEVENPTPEENAVAEKIRGIVARMSHRGKRGGRNRRRPPHHANYVIPTSAN